MMTAGSGGPGRQYPGNPSRPVPADALHRFESGCFEFAVALAVVAMPLAMGGRHPLGQAVLTAAASAAMASWTIGAWHRDGTWRFGLVDALVILGMAIGFFQVLPLPRPWIEAVSPSLVSLLPCLDGGPRSFGGWDCLSLVPGETLACLGILLAQGVFAAVVVQKIRSVADVERILRAVTWAIVILAALGLLQYLAGNGRYLWFYEFAHNQAGGAVKGTFTNRNHFAGFLAIGCGTLLVRAIAAPAGIQGGGYDRERLGGWLMLAVVAFAAVSSLSRGGTLACVVAITVALCCLARSAVWRVSTAVGFMAAAVVVAAALGIHGWDRLVGRFEVLRSSLEIGGQPHDVSLSRLTVWRSACRLITGFPWIGTGAGTHADVAPLSMPATGEIIFTHAENGFLNVGVETGVIGLAVVVIAIVAAAAAAWVLVARGDERERHVGAAIASGLAAGTAHAMADFTWYVPACSTLLVTLSGCGVALAARRVSWLPTIDLRLGRQAAVVGGVGIIVLLCGSAARQISAARAEPSWEASVKLAREIEAGASRSAERRASEADAARDPLLEKLDARITALERCVSLRPDHPRASSALAFARLERFGRVRLAAGRSLGLMDIRLAAEKAGFASHAEMVDWVRRAAAPDADDLERALGDAMRAVQISPLAGEAWCVLAQLAFLAGRPEAASDLVAQALLVRPSDSLVLFEAANQAALDGDVERAAELWRKSFAADPRQRARIIAILMPRLSSADACDLLDPDLDGLRAIDAAWSTREKAEELAEVRERRLERVLATAADRRSDMAGRCRLLMEAAALEQRLGRPVEALATLHAAIRADPSSFEAHRAAADTAIVVEDWGVAARELEWCLLRRPDRTDLREKLGKLRERGEEGRSQSAAAKLETKLR